MKYTNDLKCHNGKWYTRIEFVAEDTIPDGCLTSTFTSFNVHTGALPARNFLAYSNSLYAPVKVPEGFPEKWSVLKDGDFISEKTISYELRGLVPINSHYWGSYEEKCHEYSMWESVLMFNPIVTPQENFTNAEKSGIVDAFKRGEIIESSKDGKNWVENESPNFCSPLQWRVKRKPIEPPKFDWRPISQCDIATKVKVLVKTKYGDVLTAYKTSSNEWYCEYTHSYVFPTHFTVVE